MSPVLYVRLQNTNRGSGLQLKTSDSLLSRCAAPGSQEYTFRRLRIRFTAPGQISRFCDFFVVWSFIY
eukprot:UN20706